jgi:hypothetical protein
MTNEEKSAEYDRQEHEKMTEILATLRFGFGTKSLEEIRAAITKQLRRRARRKRKYLKAFGPLPEPRN